MTDSGRARGDDIRETARILFFVLVRTVYLQFTITVIINGFYELFERAEGLLKNASNKITSFSSRIMTNIHPSSKMAYVVSSANTHEASNASDRISPFISPDTLLSTQDMFSKDSSERPAGDAVILRQSDTGDDADKDEAPAVALLCIAFCIT